MIHDFLASWELFGDGYVAGWLLSLLLPLLGVLVVGRDQIFVGAALSQASLLGIAAALRLSGVVGGGVVGLALGSDAALSAAASLCAVLAALVTARAPSRRGESHEAVTGFVFLASASGAVLLLAHGAHGVQEIDRLVASTLLGATRGDVLLLGVLLAATLLVISSRNRELRLLLIDREMAEAVGLRARRWGLAIAVWLGLVVGLSNRLAGAIFTFACLVLPALTARATCREVRTMFVVAPLVGLGSAVVAFVLAHGLDYPPGQTVALVQCLVLAAAWLARRPPRSRAWLRRDAECAAGERKAKPC